MRQPLARTAGCRVPGGSAALPQSSASARRPAHGAGSASKPRATKERPRPGRRKAVPAPGAARRRRTPDPAPRHPKAPLPDPSGPDRATSAALTTALRCAESGRVVWIQIGGLLDGEASRPLRDAHLVYDARAIRYVGAAEDPPPRELVGEERKAPDLRLPGYTALPCLIEAHAHLFLDGAPLGQQERQAYLRQADDWMLCRARRRMVRLAQLGVAAVRDAGDNRGVGLALKREALARMGVTLQRPDTAATPRLRRLRPPSDAGQPGGPLGGGPWPAYETPGAALYRRGRYGSFMGQPLEDFRSLEAFVEARVAEGADRIKLIATGIINFKAAAVTAPPQLSAEEIAEVVRVATKRGLPTFAHATGRPGVEAVVSGGIGSVEHGFFLSAEHLARMRDGGIAWVPTFIPVRVQIDQAQALGWNGKVVAGLQRILDLHARRLRKAIQLGVPVLAGSDAGSCGVPHGLGLYAELCCLERAGISAAAALRSATGGAAAFLRLREPVGRLQCGFRTRLILTRHDPLQGLENLRKGRIVVFDGEVSVCGGDETGEGL